MRKVTFVLSLLLAAGCASHKSELKAPVKKTISASRPAPAPQPLAPGKRLAWNPNPEPDVVGYQMWFSVVPNGVRRQYGGLVIGTERTVPQFAFPIYWVVIAQNTQGMVSPASEEVVVPSY